MTVSPFTDVKDVDISMATTGGMQELTNISAIKIGTGARTLKADESGIWLGGNKFSEAPFRVDMDGNITATSLDLSNFITQDGSNQPVSGTIRLGTGSGAASIILDGANKRIIVNDGSYDRILIGYGAGLF